MKPETKRFLEALSVELTRLGLKRQRRDLHLIPPQGEYEGGVCTCFSEEKPGELQIWMHAQVFVTVYDELLSYAFERRRRRFETPSATAYFGLGSLRLDQGRYDADLSEIAQTVSKDVIPLVYQLLDPGAVLKTIRDTGNLPERLVAFYLWSEGSFSRERKAQVVGESDYEDAARRIDAFTETLLSENRAERTAGGLALRRSRV